MRVNIKPRWGIQLLKLWSNTLCYNYMLCFNYAMDTAAEPVFWFVDNFTKSLGRVFVFLVCVLIGLVVAFAYLIGLPIYWARSPPLATCLIIIGHWILVNICFHYYQAVKLSPGLPMDSSHLLLGTSITICKKCIQPKPPRCHHCTICDRCYLKMDHHCPWMNNCIGHFNHRHFFLSMIYIVLGCFFIMIFGVDIGYRQVIQGVDVLPFQTLEADEIGRNMSETALDGLGKNMEENPVFTFFFPVPVYFVIPLGKSLLPEGNEKASLLFGILVTRSQLLIIVYFVASLSIGTCFALGGLTLWHGKLISRGETSIEYNINKAERKELGEVFRNPYDLGKRKNWEVFLGLDQRSRTLFRHVLLPSAHSPSGNGYDWSHLSVFLQDSEVISM